LSLLPPYYLSKYLLLDDDNSIYYSVQEKKEVNPKVNSKYVHSNYQKAK